MLPAGLSAFDDQDGRTALAHRDRKREPDDAAADDDDIPCPHDSIVKQSMRTA